MRYLSIIIEVIILIRFTLCEENTNIIRNSYNSKEDDSKIPVKKYEKNDKDKDHELVSTKNKQHHDFIKKLYRNHFFFDNTSPESYLYKNDLDIPYLKKTKSADSSKQSIPNIIFKIRKTPNPVQNEDTLLESFTPLYENRDKLIDQNFYRIFNGRIRKFDSGKQKYPREDPSRYKKNIPNGEKVIKEKFSTDKEGNKKVINNKIVALKADQGKTKEELRSDIGDNLSQFYEEISHEDKIRRVRFLSRHKNKKIYRQLFLFKPKTVFTDDDYIPPYPSYTRNNKNFYIEEKTKPKSINHTEKIYPTNKYINYNDRTVVNNEENHHRNGSVHNYNNLYNTNVYYDDSYLNTKECEFRCY